MHEHLASECSCEGKICTKCKKPICVLGFYKDRQRLMAKCKTCAKEASNNYRKSKSDDQIARDKAYHETYYHHHRDEFRGYANKRVEKKRAEGRAYYVANRQRLIAYQAWYSGMRPDVRRKAGYKYYLAHKMEYAHYTVRRRARLRSADGNYTTQEWIELCAKCDHRCLCCGRREPEIKLTVDHIIPISKGGSNSITNIQPLCGTCNNRKNNKIIDYRTIDQ
jgi:5-methylcytosine-specific restriction endonuclease McrA